MREPENRHSFILILFLLFVPFVRFLFDVRSGFAHLIYSRLSDDAFYYYELSRHIPFFNDGIPTSGFHPLFAFLVSPFHRALDYHYAVPLSMAILVLAYSLGSLVVYSLVSLYFGRVAGLAAAGVWSVSGQLYSITTTGVETILAAVLVLCAIRCFPIPSKTPPKAVNVIAFGLLVGAAFLARMDAPLFLLPFIVYLYVWLIRRRRFGLSVTLIAVPCCVCLAWVSYMWVHTGEYFPDSGTALRVLRRVDHAVVVTDSRLLMRALRVFLRETGNLVVTTSWWQLHLCALAFVGALSGSGLLLLQKQKDEKRLALMIYSVLISAAAILWNCYYILYQGGFRIWYFAYMAIPVYCLGVPLVVVACTRITGGGQRVRPSIAFSAIALVALLSRPRIIAPQEYDKYQSAVALNDQIVNMPRGAALGSFNAGVYDYFCESDIINLNGVVNPDARRALQAGELPSYLKAKGIRYIVEHEMGQAAHFALLYSDPRVKLKKILDFREFYKPHGNGYAKATFLWEVTFR